MVHVAVFPAMPRVFPVRNDSACDSRVIVTSRVRAFSVFVSREYLFLGFVRAKKNETNGAPEYRSQSLQPTSIDRHCEKARSVDRLGFIFFFGVLTNSFIDHIANRNCNKEKEIRRQISMPVNVKVGFSHL